jgi:hypothetical protein
MHSVEFKVQRLKFQTTERPALVCVVFRRRVGLSECFNTAPQLYHDRVCTAMVPICSPASLRTLLFGKGNAPRSPGGALVFGLLVRYRDRV